jgi:hypothetical protein
MREEAAEKKRDEHFNTIRPEIPTRQERRVKEKTDVLAPTAFDDNMDLLDNVESLLIKDGSLRPTSMDINMVFTLLVEFRGAKEEVIQMCLVPRRPSSRSLKHQDNT